MGYARTRSNPKYADLSAQYGDDAAFIKAVRARVDPNGDPATFARAIARNEAGATPPQAGEGKAPLTRPSEAPASPIERTIEAGVGAGASAAGVPAPIGRFLANLGIEQAKDVGAVAKVYAESPKVGLIPAAPVYSKPKDVQRAAAASAGMMVPALLPGAGIVGKTVAPTLLRSMFGGALGGVADAGIRTGGDPASMAGGGVLGGLLGGGFHAAFPHPPAPIPNADTGAVKFDMTPPLAQASEAALSRMHDLSTTGVTPKGGGSAIADLIGLGPEVNKGRMENPLRSVEERTKAAGTPGEKIMQLFHAADDQGATASGVVNRELRTAGLNKRSLVSHIPILGREARAAEDRVAQITHDLSIGKLNPEDLTPEDLKVFEVWKKYRPTVPMRGRAAGLDVGELENYFPQNAPAPEQLRPGSKLRKDVLDNAVRNRGYATREEAAQALDDWRQFVKSGGRRGGDKYAAKMVADGRAPNIDTAKGRMLRFARKGGVKKNQNLEFSREFDFDFYDPDPRRALPTYVENAETRIAEAKNFGPELEKLDALKDQIADPHANQALGKLIDTLRGANDTESPTFGGKAIRTARMAAALKIANPLSALRNLTQGLNTLTSTDLPSTAEGYIRSAMRKGKDLAIESSAVSERSLHNSHRAMGSDGFVDKLLTIGGFKPAELVNRSGSANAHFIYARKMARNLVKNPGDGFAASELRRLGVDPAEVLVQEGLTEQQGRIAAKRGTDLTQFRQRPMDLPAVMTEHPIGRLLTQFKGFAFQQGRFLAQETLDRLRTGNPQQVARGIRNIGILAVAYPLTGEGLNQLRALVNGKQSDTGSLQEWLQAIKEGVASDDPEAKMEAARLFAQRYGEDFAQTGGFGLTGDIVQSLNYDNLLGWIVGPAIQTGANAIQTGYHAATGKDVTDYEKRKLLREVPLVGPALANRVYPANE